MDFDSQQFGLSFYFQFAACKEEEDYGFILLLYFYRITKDYYCGTKFQY